MSEKNVQLAESVLKIIRESVTDTVAVMFNTSIDVHEHAHKAPSSNDFVFCGELVQEGSTAKLMFLFDPTLIKKFVHSIFPPDQIPDPAIYESTASEIVNIVGNKLKLYLNEQGNKFYMIIPYVPDRTNGSAEDPLVQLAFSSKDHTDMEVDFYLRCA